MEPSGPRWSCTHCGTVITPAPVEGEHVRVLGTAAHTCPVCVRTLERALLDTGAALEICPQCRGMLMPRQTFAVTVFARGGPAAGAPVEPAAESELDRRIACPRCRSAMITDWYYGGGGIVVDTCPACDLIWLDAGELQRAVQSRRRV
jgi:Zn-finger nucleic acid-binding protein